MVKKMKHAMRRRMSSMSVGREMNFMVWKMMKISRT